MKKILFFILLLSITSNVYANTGCRPHLFHIEKSDNANVLYYDANISDGIFNNSNPVNIYWILHATTGKRDTLTFMEKPHLGLNVKTLVKGQQYQVNFKDKAFGAKDIIIEIDENGCPIASAEINNVKSTIERIYINISPEKSLIPDILSLDIFAINDNITVKETLEVK